MEKKRLGTGRVAFLARIDVLREKIKAGHTIAMLHDEYKNEMGISYGQFLNYVNRYIKKKPANENEGEKEEGGVKTKQKSKEDFSVNPVFNKEDFL